jgi:uncharacterized CHY-type Zn-finger protein
VKIHGLEVRGALLDGQTRCTHYASALDIIAIKFPCCDTYYPCYECHKEDADHPPQVWPRNRFHERAVLCGACGHELTVEEYLNCAYQCPKCLARFNPGCGNHYHLYFDLTSPSRCESV